MAEQLCPVCSFTKSLMKHMRRDGRCTAVSSASLARESANVVAAQSSKSQNDEI